MKHLNFHNLGISIQLALIGVSLLSLTTFVVYHFVSGHMGLLGLAVGAGAAYLLCKMWRWVREDDEDDNQKQEIG